MYPPGHGSVLDYLLDPRLAPRHAVIIDPPNQPPALAAARAVAAVGAGSRMILVGGSSDVTPGNTAATVAAIQDALAERFRAEAGGPAAARWRVPVVLFPSGADALVPGADASLFPMVLNSRDRRYLMGEPLRMATLVRRHCIVPLPSAYLVCRPGGMVGRVVDAEPIEGDSLELMDRYATVAACYGFRLIYLEAGSGADRPVTPELIAAARTAGGLPVVASGGIRTADAAGRAVRAGADWVVTGGLTETILDLDELAARLRVLIEALGAPAPAPTG